MKDKLGFEIPEHIEDLWERADKTGRELAGEIHKVKLTVEKAIERRDLSLREVTQQTVIELDYIWRTVKLIIPYAVCPVCEADERGHECVACYTRGFMSQFRYDRCIPRELKDSRLVKLAS